MAELILTDDEKAADSYLDWDDAALGRLVRSLAIKVDDEYGTEAGFGATGAHLLIGMARRANSERSAFTLEGVTDS